MATITATFPQTVPTQKKPFWKTLLKLVLFAIVIQLTFHAIMKHKEAESVDQRCNDRRNILDFRQNGNRFYRICDMGDGSFGIQILEKTGEIYDRVSSFVRKTHGKPIYDLKAVIEYVGGKSIPIP